MRVGVTGARGFIGKNLCRELIEKEYDLVEFEGEASNYQDVDEFVRDVDFVVHLARKNRDEEISLLGTNVLGVYNVVLSCTTNLKRSLVVSSDYHRKSAYKAGNEIGEKMAVSMNENMQGRNSLLILPKIFGPWCKPHYNSFVSTLLYCIAKEEPYEFMIKDPKAVLGLIHVDHVTKEIISIIESNSYNTYSKLVPSDYLRIEDIVAQAKDKENIFSELVEWYSQNM